MIVRGRGDQQPVDPPADQVAQQVALLLEALPGAADDQHVLVPAGGLLGAAGDPGPERVGRVLDE
ncbi:hypothetical protein GCM10027610_050460 [Dactylosporangium cerinum]